MVTEDWELVSNKEYLRLWKKYKPLSMKFFQKLLPDVKRFYFEDFDDFHNWCYQWVKMAVDSLDLKKEKNPEKFSFYIQLYNYFMSYTLHLTTKYMKLKGNEVSYDKFENAEEWITSQDEEIKEDIIEKILNSIDNEKDKRTILNIVNGKSGRRAKLSDKTVQLIKKELLNIQE